MKDNPEPTKNDLPAVWDLVIQDMQERDKIGVERYHTHLQPFNGRDALLDAYQEGLDKVVYLRQAIYERDNQWHDAKQNPLPLDKPVLVYLTDGSFAIATRQAACIVIGHNVPIADVIRLWIELPELPTSLQNL